MLKPLLKPLFPLLKPLWKPLLNPVLNTWALPAPLQERISTSLTSVVYILVLARFFILPRAFGQFGTHRSASFPGRRNHCRTRFLKPGYGVEANLMLNDDSDPKQGHTTPQRAGGTVADIYRDMC